MALGFIFAPSSMTAGQYDECIKKLEGAGAGRPAGFTTLASAAVTSCGFSTCGILRNCSIGLDKRACPSSRR